MSNAIPFPRSLANDIMATDIVSTMKGMDATRPEENGLLAAALDWACAQPGWWHDSGNLNPLVLRAIASHAARIGARETAETGCGLSTVLLSTVADCHTCFTAAAGNSLELVQSVAHLRHDRVNFVIGPSQVTVPCHSFSRPLDLVLIDGPHGFPFVHLEYFFFYQRIRKGGLLIVDDIHIPIGWAPVYLRPQRRQDVGSYR